MNFRYEHNCIRISDKDRSVAFYEKALGMTFFRCFSPPDNPSLELVFLLDENTGHMLELSCSPDTGRNSGECPVHMAFVAEDMDADRSRHKSMGCIFRDDPDAEVYFIADPDGYLIEIIPPVPTQRPF